MFFTYYFSISCIPRTCVFTFSYRKSEASLVSARLSAYQYECSEIYSGRILCPPNIFFVFCSHTLINPLHSLIHRCFSYEGRTFLHPEGKSYPQAIFVENNIICRYILLITTQLLHIYSIVATLPVYTDKYPDIVHFSACVPAFYLYSTYSLICILPYLICFSLRVVKGSLP